MQALILEGHYGQQIEVDRCDHCHLLWIDDLEAVRLSGLGWIDLLQSVHLAATEPSQALHLPLACPRCSLELKPVRNLTRFGRTAAHECPRRHGYFQTFGLMLAERGLVRPLGPRDRQTLRDEGRSLECLNCGASLADLRADACSHCGSPVTVLDLPRLLASVMVRHAIALPTDGARPLNWSCRACGGAVDPTRSTVCEQCSHVVVAPSLDDAIPLLRSLRPQLEQMRAPGPLPMGERLRRPNDHTETAFFRHLVGPARRALHDRSQGWVAWLLLAVVVWWLWS